MDGQRQVSRLLDEEHRASLGLLGQLEQRLARLPQRAVPADGELAVLLGQLVRHLQRDLGRHFEFEEQELFTRMADAGDDDIARLLREEHDAMREVGTELLPLAETAARGALDPDGWNALRRAALEMVERQVAHIQKESMALLPLLDELLDDETDQRLMLEYTAD